MKWDFAFILSNLPSEYLFHDHHYFMAEVAKEHINMLIEGTSRVQSAKRFFEDSRGTQLIAVGFQIEAMELSEAIGSATHQLDGFIDGLALVLDQKLPKVCPIIEYRKEGEKDLEVLELMSPQWVFMNPNDTADAEAWSERSKELFRTIIPFFDVVSGLHTHRESALCRQLLYSMKMYRWGHSVGDFGLEFMCKWNALEGIVCGGETSNKGELIRTRIPMLFGNSSSEIEGKVSKLWEHRHEAIHEARAFHSEHLFDSPPLATKMEDVEMIFRYVFAFAVSHLEKADSVRSLWTHARQYSPPDCVRTSRPISMTRFAATKIRLNTPLVIKNGGRLFDNIYASRTPASEH